MTPPDKRGPLFSIVIPAHNRQRGLDRALESVREQTFSDYEVIVVDDSSPGREVTVREHEGATVPVRYVRSEGDQGAATARNVGVQHARGVLVAFLDDDDEFVPEKLERTYAAFARHPSAGFFFSRVTAQTERGRRTRSIPLSAGLHNLYEEILSFRVRTLTSALVVKRELLDIVGLFDQEVSPAEDWDLLIRCASVSSAVYDESVLTIRHVGDFEHLVGDSFDQRALGRLRVIHKHIDAFRSRRRVLARHYSELGRLAHAAGKNDRARVFFKQALTTYPSLRYFTYYLVSAFDVQTASYLKRLIRRR